MNRFDQLAQWLHAREIPIQAVRPNVRLSPPIELFLEADATLEEHYHAIVLLAAFLNQPPQESCFLRLET